MGELVEEILEAILGLAWLEEEEDKTLGWGDMRKIHLYISEALRECDRQDRGEKDKGRVLLFKKPKARVNCLFSFY